MDFVATSQPWQGGEDELSGSINLFAWTSHSGEFDPDFDFVCSSQPFEDGQHYLDNESGMKIRLQRSIHWLFTNAIHFLGPYITAHDSKLAAAVRVRLTACRNRGRLPTPSLVRHVTMAAEIERRRKRVCTRQGMATKTARLRRKHWESGRKTKKM